MFPSPRSPRLATVTARDSKAEEADKDTVATPAKAASTLAHEVSPPVSDTSFSSDSVSYYLKLRKQEPPEVQKLQQQQQQQQQQHIRQPLPAASSSPPQGSANVPQERQVHQSRTSPAPLHQLELRQVLFFDFSQHVKRVLFLHALVPPFRVVIGRCQGPQPVSQDNEDEEETVTRPTLKHVDSLIIRQRFNGSSALHASATDSRSGSTDGLLFESQGSLDSQSKRAFAISFAGGRCPQSLNFIFEILTRA